MSNFCNVISIKPNLPNPSTRMVKFDELEFKISIYENELLKFHKTFMRQAEFIRNCDFDIDKNKNNLIEIEDNLKIHQEAVNDIEILLYLIENALDSIELEVDRILCKLGRECEFINLPATARGNIYLSLIAISGCMNQTYDDIAEFYTQSHAFVARTNITSHILEIHISLVACLEKNIAKLLEMVNAIDEMCPLIMM